MSMLVFAVSVSAVVTMAIDDGDGNVYTQEKIKRVVKKLFVEDIDQGDTDCFDKFELVEIREER